MTIIDDPSAGGKFQASSDDESGDGNHGQIGQPDVWPAPLQIEVGSLLPVPEFPKELIPRDLREFVIDTAERLPVPIDGLAAATMTTLSSIIGDGCRMRPKVNDDWSICPNLWGAVVAAPGKLKSKQVEAASSDLLRNLEQSALIDHGQAKRRYDSEIAVFEARKLALKDRMRLSANPKKKASKNGEVDLVESLECLQKKEYQELSSPVAPYERRYQTQSGTLEKLHELLTLSSPRGILMNVDELAGLFATWEKPGHESDKAFFLQAATGGQAYTHDTIGRGSLPCKSLTISILGTTQPDKIRKLVEKARNGDDDGLIQRFQLTVMPDYPKWEHIDRKPNLIARKKAQQIAENLGRCDDFAIFGAKRDAPDGVPYFGFSPAAYEVYREWNIQLHKVIIEREMNPLLKEHFAKYASLMPTLALIFHLAAIASGSREPSFEVCEGDAAKAASWCDLLAAHARRIYGLGKVSQDLAATALAERLAAGKLENGFTARELYRRGWQHLDTKELAEFAIDELVNKHWLRGASLPVGSNGGASTVHYMINPQVRSER